MTLRGIRKRILALFQRPQLERELEDEIRAHLELAERDGIAAGMSPTAARRAARLRFGGIEQMKEEHRDRRSVSWIETSIRDLRFGFASLQRNPGFATVAIGVLALGIGANAAMFSLVDAVLLKPLPFPQPDRIVQLWEAPRPGVVNATSTLDFLDWRRLSQAFSSMAAETSASAALTGEGEPARLAGKLVTADYFRVFGSTAQLGRTFNPEDERPGAVPVLVLSHAAWRTYFGEDPDILSRRAILDGEAHQIIGVLPPGPFDRDQSEFWKPLIFQADQMNRDFHWLSVTGRLRDGVTLAGARAEMEQIHGVLAEISPANESSWTIVVEPLERLLVGDSLRQSVKIGFGAVVIVLLIACANVASLLLVRGSTRCKEIAVRAALGAGRRRLVLQLLTETLVLCLAGGIAGIVLAAILIQTARPFVAGLLPYTAAVTLDVRVLVFAAGTALGVTLLVGILPSLKTSMSDLSQSMNQANRGSSAARGRLRSAIVIGEIALSLILICGAMLLFQSLHKLQGLSTGIRIDNVITMSVSLPSTEYPTSEQAALFYESLAERLRGVSGVENVGLSTHLPLRWIGNGEGILVPGVEEIVKVRLKRVDAGYFDALDIPIVEGRGISGRDRQGAARVVVANQALAARLREVTGWDSAVGQNVRLSVPAYLATQGLISEAVIVGVIRSERVDRPGSPDPPVAYVPVAQVPSPFMRIFLQTRTGAESVMPGVRDAVRAVAPNLPLGDIATMRQVRQRTLASASRPAWLIGLFAAVAALLAAAGIHAVLAHSVVQERREIGIRMALGASLTNVLTQVLRNAALMIALGVGLGLIGSLLLTNVMENLLFQVSPLDPTALAIAALLTIVIGLLAAAVPAKRAASVDPMAVLREE